ncbi:imidazoleglycerol-phosphate dehydratase HisB [candidate division KSB1 bacterium]|nr:imidazoleglycerol-phosphate dehydratase HisB [bacterium]OQX60477.1 MAG: imidazoleglycerol-phosphate dehydratase [candidate division KSB1 bacterium 4484_219]RKY78269.1 MAG: imidazoleglycerol-phosphate dehydratase HisB [candidate division KSB1 bacterium]RKY78741.1 MAG: imidazoleglycerol-phosphate dehydratase HisB [candidate division KSB1 bacterium]
MTKAERKAKIARQTTETKIELSICLDGQGVHRIQTGMAFFDHMLAQFAKHGFFDLNVTCQGDLEVDYHHSVEDVGICLGEAVRQALGDKCGIRRFGSSHVPMDEALARVVIDLSGRPFLAYNVAVNSGATGNFDVHLLEEFFRAFVNNAQITLHIDLLAGKNSHHCFEAVFKAFGRALDAATSLEAREAEIPSTKGNL